MCVICCKMKSPNVLDVRNIDRVVVFCSVAVIITWPANPFSMPIDYCSFPLEV